MIKKLDIEKQAFDDQIKTRIAHGHIPDLRNVIRCEYFENNIWRDPYLVKLCYGEQFNMIKNSICNQLSKEISILEVGTGPGFMALELARNGFDVTGIDISEENIKIAKKFSFNDQSISERSLLEYVCIDFFEMKGKYDVLLFRGSLHHLENNNRTINQILNLLNTNGLLILLEPDINRITDTNSNFALIIKTLLSFINKYHKRIEIPFSFASFDSLLNEITLNSKHQLNDGTNEQSVMDNELDFYDIYSILLKKFYQIEKKRHVCILA